MIVCFLERKRQPTLTNEPEKKDEEEWPLKDVVFIEDIKTVPVGKVLKVSYCHTSFITIAYFYYFVIST